MRNRYYTPGLGRFTAADPIAYGGGLNLYAFAGADPVNAWDLTGLDWVSRRSDNTAIWQVEKDDAWNTNIGGPHEIGKVEPGGVIRVDPKYGKGFVSYKDLEQYAARYWYENFDISDLSYREQAGAIARAIAKVQAGQQIRYGGPITQLETERTAIRNALGSIFGGGEIDWELQGEGNPLIVTENAPGIYKWVWAGSEI